MALRLLFVVAFCVMTVGAAGFAKDVEPLAWPLYGGGLVLTLVTGVALKRRTQRETAAAAAGSASLEVLVAEVRAIHADVLAIQQSPLQDAALLARLEAVLARCALLGQRNEEFLRTLGFEAYVRVWDGFATGERLIARAWSMTADGFAAEGRAELPRAQAALARAAG